MISNDINYSSYTVKIIEDPRFLNAVKLFNSSEWYQAHDLFEDIWHETSGCERQILQAIIQISVAQLHLENGNFNGAIMLFGESLSRLRNNISNSLGLDLNSLYLTVESRLIYLQQNKDTSNCDLPFLKFDL